MTKIEPNNRSSHQSLENIANGFEVVKPLLKKHGTITGDNLGLPHVELKLNLQGNRINYLHGSGNFEISGMIRSHGEGQGGVNVYKLGKGAIKNSSILFNDLAGAFNVISKIKVDSNLANLLPSESIITENKRYAGEISLPLADCDSPVNKQFLDTLYEESTNIYGEGIGENFQNGYAVFEMPSGFWIAYNPSQGNATYITENLEDLFRSKKELRETGDAARFCRGSTGNWRNEVLDFIK